MSGGSAPFVERLTWADALPALPVLLSFGHVLTVGIDRDAVLHGSGTFTVWSETLSRVFLWSALGSALTVVLLTARRSPFRPNQGLAGVATLWTLLAVCGLGAVPWSLGRMPASMGEPLTLSDGTLCAPVGWGIGQGRGISIARIESRGWLRRVGEVVVSSGTDSPAHPAECVRPAHADASAGLIEGAGGVVALVEGARCWGAWDPQTGDAWTNVGRHWIDDVETAGPQAPVRRAHPLESMSPFLLLGDTLEGRAEDLDELVAQVDREARRLKAEGSDADPLGDGRGGLIDSLPSRASLLASLDSPNPWVRAAARRILDAASAGPQAGGERR